MPIEFFSKVDKQASPDQTIGLLPKCAACGLYKTCHSPKMQVDGKGRRRILVVGEAPGSTEDQKGKTLCGESGQLFEKLAHRSGIDLRRDCWSTNALICRPPKGRAPAPAEIAHCRPNVRNTILQRKPDIIVLLGPAAVQSVLGWLWRADVGQIHRWVGWRIPCQELNAWICPTYHPKMLLSGFGTNNDVLERLMSKHLSAIDKLKGPPWKKVPDYASQVECLMDDQAAAKVLNSWHRETGMMAFDYETNMLKPDAEAAEIVSCSVCMNREHTIAFPWTKRTRGAMYPLLQSKKLEKIASNLKFEERWTLKEYGRRVVNWGWDTMLAAHVLDNRPDITGLKFQAFVRLGLAPYDHGVKHKLKSDNANEPNQIKDIDWNKLLLYNGLDSLLEYILATRQWKDFPQ